MNLARNIFIYGLGGAVSRMAAIFLVPFYTRSFSTEEYGQLEIYLVIHSLFVVVGGMQIESAVAFEYFSAKSSRSLSALLRSAFILSIIGSLGIMAVVSVIGLTGQAFSWISAKSLLFVGAMTFPAQLLGVQQVVLRFNNRAASYATVSLIDLMLCSSFTILFVLVFKLGIFGALAGIFFSKVICVALVWGATFGGCFMRKEGEEKFETEWSLKMLKYGIPSMPAVIVSWVQNVGGRLLVVALLSLDAMAIVGVSLKVAAIFSFIILSLRLAWEPVSVRHLSNHCKAPLFYRAALEWYVVILFFVLSISALSSPWIIRALAPPAYSYACGGALFMLAAQYWIGITNMTIIGIQGARKTSKLFPVYGGGAVANILVLVSTYQLLGPAAAGLAMLIGSVVTSFLSVYFSNRLFDTQFPWRLLIVTFAASVALVYGLYVLNLNFGDPVDGMGALIYWLVFGTLIFAFSLILLTWGGLGFARCAEMAKVARGFVFDFGRLR
jgi:O-antigen/teichoic acid export membrane protein